MPSIRASRSARIFATNAVVEAMSCVAKRLSRYRLTSRIREPADILARVTCRGSSRNSSTRSVRQGNAGCKLHQVSDADRNAGIADVRAGLHRVLVAEAEEGAGRDGFSARRR